jgi:hypothetical protein
MISSFFQSCQLGNVLVSDHDLVPFGQAFNFTIHADGFMTSSHRSI